MVIARLLTFQKSSVFWIQHNSPHFSKQALLYVQTWSQNTCKSVNTESGNGKAQGWGGDREKILNLKAFLDQDSTSTEMAT